MLNNSSEASVTQMVLALNRSEKVNDTANQEYEGGFTSPAWVAEGIEIESQQ